MLELPIPWCLAKCSLLDQARDTVLNHSTTGFPFCVRVPVGTVGTLDAEPCNYAVNPITDVESFRAVVRKSMSQKVLAINHHLTYGVTLSKIGNVMQLFFICFYFLGLCILPEALQVLQRCSLR